MADGVYLTAEQIATRLQITTRTIYRWLDSGTLKGVKLGKVWRVNADDFENFLKQRENTPAEDGSFTPEKN